MRKNETQKTNEFINRVADELDKINTSSEQKKIILDILGVEFSNPTTEKDAITRYRNIILANKK
jgi:hypothetical protein